MKPKSKGRVTTAKTGAHKNTKGAAPTKHLTLEGAGEQIAKAMARTRKLPRGRL